MGIGAQGYQIRIRRKKLRRVQPSRLFCVACAWVLCAHTGAHWRSERFSRWCAYGNVLTGDVLL